MRRRNRCASSERCLRTRTNYGLGRLCEQLTEQAAGAFAQLAEELRRAGYEPQRLAHFLNKLLFMLFAEDAKLLPGGLVRDLGKNLRSSPIDFSGQLAALFRLMSTKPGGTFGPLPIQWFNGGLFDGDDVLPLTTPQIDTIVSVSLLDWSQVEPAIFGTLFERGLDPDKRSRAGRALHRPPEHRARCPPGGHRAFAARVGGREGRHRPPP